VKAEVQKNLGDAHVDRRLKAIIIQLSHRESPPSTWTNMSKPILDIMQEVVYNNDRQITQAEITHVRIDAPMSIAGASKILVDAVRKGQQFVYIRIEDAIDPFPLRSDVWISSRSDENRQTVRGAGV